MRRGITGHGEPERTDPDQVNAALVRQLIGDALAQLCGEHRAVIRRSHYLGWTTAHGTSSAPSRRSPPAAAGYPVESVRRLAPDRVDPRD